MKKRFYAPYWVAMPLLQIVVVSTRPGRKGPAVAAWFEGIARAHEGFDVEVADLGTIGLPLFDEPEHPRLHNYQHAHTLAWSAIVSRSDAFVFVTPEYNYGPPPSLINALTYLAKEWAYKPAAFVSYGGISGGMRGVQQSKLTLTTLKMMPIPEAVVVPKFATRLATDGGFVSDEQLDRSARTMLNELARWTSALQVLRAPAD